MSDLIDREQLRRALYEEAMVKDSEDQRWDSGCWIRYRMAERLIEEAPTAQPKLATKLPPNCHQIATDCISRQAAIDAIYEMHVDGEKGVIKALPRTYGADLREIVERIEELPSAQPERKEGRWIRLTNDLAQCSECKDYIDFAILCGYNFCPNCGTKMGSEQDG